MKKTLKFELEGCDSVNSLSHMLYEGIKGFAIESAQHGRPTSLWLFCSDQRVVKIQSLVTTVGPWDEVGTLRIKCLVPSDVTPNVVSLAPAWSDIRSVRRLILDENDFSAESGLSLVNRIGEELLVLPGAFPYTVEILAPFFVSDFQPECEPTAYRYEEEQR